MNIIKKFKEMGITYEKAIAPDANSIPTDHYAYHYVWKLIDDYTDKKHLYEIFKKTEDDAGEVDDNFTFIDTLYTNKKLADFVRLTWYDIDRNEKIGFTTKVDTLIFKISEKFGDEPWYTSDFINLFNDVLKNPENKYESEVIGNHAGLKEEYMKICAPVKMISETSFSDAIKKRYNIDDDKENIELHLDSDMNIILNEKKRADSHFLDISRNFSFKGVIIESQGFEDDAERKMLVTEALEKHFNLLQDPKNKSFYISNGQGIMIPFEPDNDEYIYVPLRKKFQQKLVKKDTTSYPYIIWSRPSFYKLGEQYCSHFQEPEAFLVSFNNCCYNSKTKTIYELDYRFPRLPMKRSRQNFIFNKDLSGKGGALEEILNYCFTEQDRKIIFKYLGRALFERGYTQHQEILMFLGKGGTGKTTFATSLSKIFDNVSSMSAEKMDNNNNFAFSQLPNKDFIIMDEITNAKKGFIDMMKQMSNGAESLSIEQKNVNTFDLPAEYVPMMIAIGNRLLPALYDHFAGEASLRRFCIVFLKNSILEAKPLGVDDDGNEIRGAYDQEDLFRRECIEWLIQQIILHYDSSEKTLLNSEEASVRAQMAAFPEAWVIENYLEVIRDPVNTNLACEDADMPEILLEDIFDCIMGKIDEYMLERTLSDPKSEQFSKLIEDTLNVKLSTHLKENGDPVTKGLVWHDEKLLNDKKQK